MLKLSVSAFLKVSSPPHASDVKASRSTHSLQLPRHGNRVLDQDMMYESVFGCQVCARRQPVDGPATGMGRMDDIMEQLTEMKTHVTSNVSVNVQHFVTFCLGARRFWIASSARYMLVCEWLCSRSRTRVAMMV